MKAVEASGQFKVALSGGSLPKTLLSLLDDPEVDFTKWRVYFVDERFVPLNHDDSNFKGSQQLLAKVPSEYVFPINPELSLEECAADYEQIVGKVKLDLVLLGMGEDGHTASLFPGHPLLDEKDRMIASITDSPKNPPRRITFTFPMIESAANICFVAGGAGKQGVLAAIFGEKQLVLPAGRVLKMRPDTIFLVDKNAAAKL